MPRLKLPIFEAPTGKYLIPLTKGEYARVDPCDAEWVSQWFWNCCNGYAQRRTSVLEPGPSHIVGMHRELAIRWGWDVSGLEVDHIDNCSRNNIRTNLRLATKSNNQMNRKLCARNTSGIKGVKWDPARGKWLARIVLNGKEMYLGRFEKLEDAARAYAEASAKYHKEFGRLG